MKKLIQLVLVLIVGIVLGYILFPTIDKLVKKQDVVKVETIDKLKDKANEKAESYIEK